MYSDQRRKQLREELLFIVEVLLIMITSATLLDLYGTTLMELV